MKVPVIARRLPVWIVAGIAAIAAGAAAYRFWPAAANDGGDAGIASVEPVSVEVAVAELRDLRPSLEIVGTLVAIPERTASLSSQLGGWVEKLVVVEGERVHANDPVVLLDSSTARSDLRRAEAIVAEKQAVLNRLKRGYLPEELEAARQDRDKAKAAMESARGELAALEPLRARNEVSTVLFETKQKLVAQTEAAYASASAHAKLLEQGTATELIDEAQAFLDAAKADADHARLALEWCRITSPIDGIVVQMAARQGQFFDRAVPLATIMDLTEMFVQLRVPSSEFAKVQIGAAVEVEMMADPERKIPGVVTRIAGQADPLTGNLDVYATISNQPGEILRPGLGCRARVWLPPIVNAVVIPVSAVSDRSGMAVVTVIRDGRAYEVEVRIGTETSELVHVLEGIVPGDQVATAGGYGLPEGCPVRIVEDLASSRKVR